VTLKTGILSKGASSPQIPTPSVYAPHPCHSVFECTARKYTVPYRIVSYAVITLPQGFFLLSNNAKLNATVAIGCVPDTLQYTARYQMLPTRPPIHQLIMLLCRRATLLKATSQVRLNTIPSRLGGDYKLKNHWRASYVLLSRTNLVVRVE